MYGSSGNQIPIYQLMASGLTTSTGERRAVHTEGFVKVRAGYEGCNLPLHKVLFKAWHQPDESSSCMVILKTEPQEVQATAFRPLLTPCRNHCHAEAGVNFSCTGYRTDPTGLRDHPACDFVRGPSFGMLEVEFTGASSSAGEAVLEAVRMQVRDGKDGAVRLESTLSPKLGHCNPRKK